MDGVGIGVMLHTIFGDSDTNSAMLQAQGKIIAALSISDKELTIKFNDETGIVLFDDGQSCCEHRYMHTDDNLPDFIGAQFLGAKIQDGPTETDECGDPKESQFLIVSTSLGEFTVVNYNEHNGYYGGFWIAAKSTE